MLVYLSKKIAIPNGVNLDCISWNRDMGWIACGGESGLLKVLKLETPSGPEKKLQGIAASSNLSMNQTLEGHTGAVKCVTWNPHFQKLTTSDESGLIIVWMLHKGMWYEEMINNRNKSVVRDMKWTTDGRKIAIVYEDGAVIVGSVDGNRLWGNDLNLPLRFVEWSPDGRFILFVTLEAEVWIYDCDGRKVRCMTLAGQDQNALAGEVAITGIHWWASGGGPGSSRSSSSSSAKAGVGGQLPSTLCIAFDDGKIQLSRGDDESTVETIETGFKSVGFCRWCSRGNVLAVVGPQEVEGRGSSSKSRSEVAVVNFVKFYTNHGKFIRSLKIPGEHISAVAWEGGDLRLSLAVDSYIYFANIRHSYMWAYFLNTVVFAHQRGDRRETSVVFWDLVSLEVHTKQIVGVKFVVASGDLCAVVIAESIATSGTDESSGSGKLEGESKSSSPKKIKNAPVKQKYKDVYTVQLRNAIGAVVDSKLVPFAPKHVCMSAHHVTVTDDRNVFCWHFQHASSKAVGNAAAVAAAMANKDEDDNGADNENGSSNSGSSSQRASRVRMFDIGSASSGMFSAAQSAETYVTQTEAIADPIVCSCSSDRFLVLARKSGAITRFNVPHLTEENSYFLREREPARIELNCYSSKLALIDSMGLFTILDLEARVTDAEEKVDEDGEGAAPAEKLMTIGTYYGKKLNLERKDVWDIKWSENDPDMFVIMEKTKMVVFNGETPETPVVSSGYLARFKDLEVRVVTMDDLMSRPDQITKDSVVDFETRALHEVRDVITAEGLQAGYRYAEKNPHPRLWRLLGHAAVEALDLSTAEKAFVRCGDYYGIQLAKQLAAMPDKMKARAEAAVFVGKLDEAESIYREIDRKDLAIQLRKRLGDYTRVVQLLQTGGGNDTLVRESWDRIGEHYADRFKWKKAAQYFALSRNFERLAECYYRLENFEELSKLRVDLQDSSPLLITLAKQFESVGMEEEATDCYLRSGRPPKEAVDCCVLLNKWDKALELAEKFDYPQVEGLLIKYAMNLVSTDRKLEAVEFFRCANKPTEAAMLISDIAENVATNNVNPLLAKKLHVLSALEVERHRKRIIDLATATGKEGAAAGGNVAHTTAATLETLMMTAMEPGGFGTAGGTLTATLGATLGGGTLGGGGAKRANKAFGNAWRGAAAYHYYILALRQFYAGQLDAAMKTAIKLCEYDDILNARHIYSLLCLTAFKNKFFSICSKAFVKLETLPNVSEDEREAIQMLAVQIFLQNVPADPADLPEPYVRCLQVGRTYKACVASGRAVQESPVHMCKTCRHLILEHELERAGSSGKPLQHCPLCHSALIHGAGGGSSATGNHR